MAQQSTAASAIPAEAAGWSAFLTIWTGQLVSVLGTGMTAFALSLWVYQQSGSVTLFALISVCAVVPALLASPLTGVLVDRWDRRRVLIGSNIGPLLSILALAGLHAAGALAVWHIYILTVLNGLFAAFQQPAFLASTTLLVPKQHYGRASGMLQLGLGITQLLAPVLAGLLVVSLPLSGILLIDAATFGVATVSLLLVRIPSPPAERRAGGLRQDLRDNLLFGLRYVRERPGLLGLLLFFGVTNCVLGFVHVLITPLVLSFAEPPVLGRVQAAAGLGLLLGAVLMSVWGGPRRRMRGIFGATLVQGLALILGSLAPSALLVGAAALVFLFCSTVINTCSQALWQTKVPPEAQGRIFAVRFVVAWSAMPLAYVLAGPLAERVFVPLLLPGGALTGPLGPLLGVGPGRGIALLLLTLGVVFLGAVALGVASPRLRNLQSELPDALPGPAADR